MSYFRLDEQGKECSSHPNDRTDLLIRSLKGWLHQRDAGVTSAVNQARLVRPSVARINEGMNGSDYEIGNQALV